MSLHELFKRHFSVHHSPASLVSISPIGFQSQMFWGLIYQVPVFKVGVPDVGYDPFTPQGLALSFEFSSTYGSSPFCGLPQWRWSLWWDYVSDFPTWFSVVFLSFAWCEEVTPFVFRVFLRGNCSTYRSRFGVSVGGSEFRIFLRCNLQPESRLLMFKVLLIYWTNICHIYYCFLFVAPVFYLLLLMWLGFSIFADYTPLEVIIR